MARLCEAEINLRQSLSHQRYRVNRALIVWLAVRRQGIARKLRSSLSVLARRGEVAMDSRGELFLPPAQNYPRLPLSCAISARVGRLNGSAIRELSGFAPQRDR